MIDNPALSGSLSGMLARLRNSIDMSRTVSDPMEEGFVNRLPDLTTWIYPDLTPWIYRI